MRQQDEARHAAALYACSPCTMLRWHLLSLHAALSCNTPWDLSLKRRCRLALSAQRWYLDYRQSSRVRYQGRSPPEGALVPGAS